MPDPNQEKQPSKLTRWHVDAALWIALIPIAAATLRIWTYSGGDQAVFLTLLRTLNVPAVLTGTCFTVLPSIAGTMSIILLMDRKAREQAMSFLEAHSWSRIALGLGFIILVFTASITSLIIIGILILVLLAYLGGKKLLVKMGRIKTSTKSAKKESEGLQDWILNLAFSAVVLLAMPTSMWLPLEKLHIENEGDKTAYVLESTTEWTTALSIDYNIEIYPTNLVKSRIICHSEYDVFKSSLAMLQIQDRKYSKSTC